MLPLLVDVVLQMATDTRPLASGSLPVPCPGGLRNANPDRASHMHMGLPQQGAQHEYSVFDARLLSTERVDLAS